MVMTFGPRFRRGFFFGRGPGGHDDRMEQGHRVVDDNGSRPHSKCGAAWLEALSTPLSNVERYCEGSARRLELALWRSRQH